MTSRRSVRTVLLCSFVAVASLNPRVSGAQEQQAATADSGANTAVSGTETPNGNGSSTSDMSDPQTSTPAYQNSIGAAFLKHLASDQYTIWTSPARLRFADVDWLLPLGTATGILLATDSDSSRHLSNSPSLLKHSNDFSTYGLATMVAAGGGLYLWGHFMHEEHKRETGLLAGEAAIDALAVDYALKYSLGRERPLTDNYRGAFFKGGDSFPSEHSAAAWAIAGVIAHEYPGTLPTVLSYGVAAAISASRVSAKQHFPSDVLVGGAIGWLVAEEVYRHHHDPDLGGRDWQTYSDSIDAGSGRKSTSVGSPYVELDSWIYPAIERLAALGYIHSAYLGVRPWTRLECADLVEEAGDEIRAEGPSAESANEIYLALVQEFQGDLNALAEGGPLSADVESVYSRVTGISGQPLTDGDHFGQTIVDDFGRPYKQGANSYDGFSGYASAGRFVAYVRGEYQAAPSASPYSLGVREAIAKTDGNPLQPPIPIASTSQFRLLDTYLAADYADWNFSFGKQSLWWGPGDEGALIFSDNAEPIYMFRMTPERAFEVPLLSRVLGPFKTDFFVGKLSGNEFPPRPVIHGENISFKPARNLEIGFSRLVEFGGVGRPMTAGAIWNSYVSVKSSVNYRASRNPGKRTSGFDFSYRVPFIASGLTLYAESAAADDVVPLASLPRAAWNSGIYLPRVLSLSRLDLRIEGGYTDPVTPRSNDGEYLYWDLFYHDLSTNKNNLIGSWLGREGKGVRALSTYSFSAHDNIQFGYRQAKVAKDFIPSGETINDGSVTVNWWPKNFVNLSASVQYEKWLAPLLATGPQTNWTSTFEICFWPRALRTHTAQTNDTAEIQPAEKTY
jgi:membrane-associated phospholipid phosphatase